jgi:hypothetical protein
LSVTFTVFITAIFFWENVRVSEEYIRYLSYLWGINSERYALNFTLSLDPLTCVYANPPNELLLYNPKNDPYAVADDNP